jgi:hypothetical protein
MQAKLHYASAMLSQQSHPIWRGKQETIAKNSISCLMIGRKVLKDWIVSQVTWKDIA